MKRYVVTLEMYVYAENDEGAKAIAKQKAEYNKKNEDNRCSVAGIVEQPFGSFKIRSVA